MDELGQPLLGSAEVERVPFAAYEAQAERNVRTIKYMVLGWVISVIALCLAMVVCLSYSEEVVTETTTETYERYAQADNQGNAIIGDGDNNIGDSTYNANGQGNDDNENN